MGSIKNDVDKRVRVFTVPAAYMKKNPLIPALIGVLAVLTLFGAWAIWNSYICSKKSRALQAQAANINNTRVVMDALAKETLEYSKKNPAIDPILISVRLKEGPGAAAKPASR